MKKNRSATLLSVLCATDLQANLEAIIFKETTTIGIRSYPVNRTVAERSLKTVKTDWGSVTVKVSSMNGAICSTTPEYEECRKLAAATGVPLKEIIAAAREL